ncbi:prenyltransferase/squalene oxidase repeat-containing protein, partial [Streptomyces sp. UNOC14_S4]|uniref:prenyltransferase/squalene oxidase repeat-containing protein n=1 Tax=Streptomyces sp. UNOC14_S4 TaxID=2872340 RepID=UPI001E478C2F
MADELRERVRKAILTDMCNLAGTQEDDGSWHYAYGGATFLLPMYVALRHVSGQPVPAARAARMRDHLISCIGDDGGIGMYPGGPGTVFTSTLGYVALRLLGEEPGAGHTTRLRTWLHEHGTPLRSASWGKVVLCAMGLYEYRGLHPLTPESWLLPRWAPLHPRRLWCHARQVYLPMAWLYGRRAAASADDGLVRSLRAELYARPYEHIDWAAHRSSVAPCDNYRPLSVEFRTLSALLRLWERLVPRRVRGRALACLERHIDYEDEVTGGLRIGPVNAVLNTLVHHFREPGGERFRTGLEGLDAYVWDRETAIDMQCYNSSQLWDTAFTVQALAAGDRAVEGRTGHGVLRAALRFIDSQQIREEPPEQDRFHRDPSRGGWPFSTRAHGWPISDCTAEALTAVLHCHASVLEPLDPGRLEEAVRLLLAWQNPDGGWPTYERVRGGRWLERLNPSQVFDDIMVDYSHVECTASCLQALSAARSRLPSFSGSAAIDRAVRAGRDFLLKSQRADGGFEGNWGICFTYGTWFAVRGLLAAGVPPTDPAVERACAFLLSLQHEDGSWGESPLSCTLRRPVPSREGRAVMTAWAVLALSAAGRGGHPACVRGVEFL